MADTYLNKLLGDNEKIIQVTRQHWLVLAGEIISESVLALAWIVLVTLLLVLPPMLLSPWIALAYILLVFPLASLWRDVLVWSNRKFVVTSFRVIQLSGVLNKNVTDSSLEKVNDVKLEQSMLGRMFGYGDIEILTASELGVNKFHRLAQPVSFKTAMLNAKERLEHADSLPGAWSKAVRSGAAPDIPTLISQLDELRKQGVLTEEEFQAKKAQLLAKL
jgi:uncharacterized membrane protein YdbT with pleckstrin-like domain